MTTSGITGNDRDLKIFDLKRLDQEVWNILTNALHKKPCIPVLSDPTIITQNENKKLMKILISTNKIDKFFDLQQWYILKIILFHKIHKEDLFLF